MAAYYNEFDPYAAQWLRNLITQDLIAPGDVDERSITEVSASDLVGYSQCHFFAGIGGWSLALRLAGWPDDRPVWTGSCPCQPLSTASRRRNSWRHDKRNLWPVWANLIAGCRPAAIFGEQVVASEWVDEAIGDLEAVGASVWAGVLPAWFVEQDHERARAFFAAHTNSDSQSSRALNAKMERVQGHGSDPGSVARSHGVSSRVGRLRAYGNAIVPQVAAEVIAAYMEVTA